MDTPRPDSHPDFRASLSLSEDTNSICCEGHELCRCSLHNRSDKSLVSSGFSKRCSSNLVHSAITSGNYDFLRQLVNHGCLFTNLDQYESTALHLACSQRGISVEIINLLLDSKVDVNSVRTDGVSAAMLAADQCNTEVLKVLQRRGADFNLKDDKGWCVLHYVINSFDNPSICTYLLQHVDINVSDNLGKTALLLAVSKGRTETVDCLIKNGADLTVVDNEGKGVLHNLCFCDNNIDILYKSLSNNIKVAETINKRDRRSHTPLHLAAIKGNETLLSALLESGADPNLETRDEGYTVLHLWASGKIDSGATVRKLLQHGGQVNGKTKNWKTPLMLACVNGNSNIVKELLYGGARLNETEASGQSALHFACFSDYDNADIVEDLVKAGEVIDSEKYQITPLMTAAHGNKVSQVRTLLKFGADVKVESKIWGWNALLYACDSSVDDTNILEQLVLSGASIESTDTIGNTPLMLCAQKGHVNKVTWLLCHGCDVKAVDREGCNALHLIAQKKDPVLSIIQMLLKSGCNPNAKDKHGRTPMMYAAIESNIQLVRHLLSLKCDCNIVDKVGKSVLHCSCEGREDFDEMVQCLVESGCDVNQVTISGETPLMLALKNQYFKSAEVLLNSFHFSVSEQFVIKDRASLIKCLKLGLVKILGLFPNEWLLREVVAENETNIFLRPIHLVQNAKQVKLLKSYGADPTDLSQNGYGLLHLSVMETGRNVVLNDLSEIVNFIPLNQLDIRERTPLHCCCLPNKKDEMDSKELTEHKLQCAHRLLEAGASVGKADKYGATCLQIALNHGLESMVTLLDSYKAIMYTRGHAWIRAVHWLVLNCKTEEEFIQKLKLVDTEATDSHGRTVFHYVAMPSPFDPIQKDWINKSHFTQSEVELRLKFARILQNLNRNINSCNKDGKTPLEYAATYDFREMAMYLSNNGGYINVGSRKQASLLHWAVEKDIRDKTDHISSYISDNNVNSVDADKRTPLHYVALQLMENDSNQDVGVGKAKRLIESGAVVNCQDVNGDTPLIMAVKREAAALASLLMFSGADPQLQNGVGLSAVTVAKGCSRKDQMEHIISKVNLPLSATCPGVISECLDSLHRTRRSFVLYPDDVMGFKERADIIKQISDLEIRLAGLNNKDEVRQAVDRQRAVLQQNMVFLCQQINPADIFNHLIQDG